MTSPETCSTCVWWNRAAPCRATMLRDPQAEQFLGTCELNAPVVVPGIGGLPITVFPQTHADRTCGHWADHRPVDGGDDGEPVVVPFQQREAA